MIIESEKDVTKAVLSEYARTKNPRLREIMSALVRHLHDFAREVKLTEEEFQAAIGLHRGDRQAIQRNPQRSRADGGLARLLVADLPPQQRQQRPDRDRRQHARSVLAHGFAADQERRLDRALADAGRRCCSSMPGFKDTNGKPIEGAEVDIWHSSPEGFYENQDPVQADMNLRGKFTTDKDGHISFRSVKPAGYPIPIDGPVGELLRAAGRHNMRPAHLHFLVYKPGFKTLISQIYDPEDKNIETDVQFGVTRHLIGNYVRHDEPRAEAPDVKPPWYSLEHTFVMENGTARLPRPPITGKAQGERPEIPHLEPA